MSNKVPILNFILVFQKECLKTGITVEKYEEFTSFMNLWASNEKTITFKEVHFYNSPELITLSESFFNEGNSPFLEDINNKLIIDIGGNIGDTALMFAKEGAEVYAYEPVPPIYDLALKNIDLNPDLKGNIHFFNKAIFNKKGKIKIAYQGNGSSGGSSIYNNAGEIFEVDTITIDDILKENNIKPDLLQMDCEGAEYDIIPNSDLSGFKELLIEYHQGITGINRTILIDNLINQGFIIDDIFKAPGIDNIEEMGIIRALNKQFIKN